MESEKIIYSQATMDFVAVAVKYCAFLEQAEGQTRDDFVDTLLKLLPVLYVKAQLLPEVESEGDFLPAPQVTEGDYEWVRHAAYTHLGGDDQYLDISYEYTLQTDETQWRSVAEHLADVYQPVRNFLAVYQGGTEEAMSDALWALEQTFAEYWGQALVDALRRLHALRYTLGRPDEEDDD